ncbi:MAG: ammonia-forming cytochrome c nitrite reductase subunit c552, partial [Lachnospiraceae bacterium]|nr:ammonia-forming cytochrome c nitrite reductase subunit c552 [Lachnospiraceae bacterium]
MQMKRIIQAVGAAAAGAIVFLCSTNLAGLSALNYMAPSLAALNPITAADIVYKQVDAPETMSADGVITADEWAAIFPEHAVSMGANAENSYHVSYLEEDPYLVNLYEGYGFARDYESARGHAYTLEDVAATARPHATANCLTCKTPNFTKMVNDQGAGVYSMDFNEVYEQMNECISCYTCHGNMQGNEGQRVVTHSYVHDCLGDNIDTINISTMVCGQCHIEYYFKPENKETSMPYTSLEEMTPEAILAYYDSIGFADWTQESTGAKMLKAQHPELETVTHGKHGSLLSCADCHMPLERAEDGSVYHSHKLVSPLESEQLLTSCAKCHGDTDMTAFVRGIQEEITARESEVGNKLSDFKDKLAEANQSGSKDEAELEEIRYIYRSAQWYFDFCYVENSEGAHNS